jgi:hypothetical protein
MPGDADAERIEAAVAALCDLEGSWCIRCGLDEGQLSPVHVKREEARSILEQLVADANADSKAAIEGREIDLINADAAIAELTAERDALRQRLAEAEGERDTLDTGWQQHLAYLHPNRTGDGCDSGDPRDWTAAAIGLTMRDLENERDEARDERDALQQKLAEALEEARDNAAAAKAQADERRRVVSETIEIEHDLSAKLEVVTAERDALLGDKGRAQKDGEP